jgi:hypothetical protein
MIRKSLVVFAACVSITSAARADGWLDKTALVTNRQWLEARLNTLAATFAQQPKAQMVLNADGGVDVNLYYTSTRLLQRQGKERDDLLKSYIFDPVQKGLNDIQRGMPAAGGLERPSLKPTYYLNFLRTEAQQYVRVASGDPSAMGWDLPAIKGFAQDLQGSDFSQGSLFAKYELTEAQWLSVQLSLFSLQKSEKNVDVRCVVSKERKISCRMNLTVEKLKGGQAKEFYSKKRDELGKRVNAMNDELDRLFGLEGREVRFSSKQQLEWEINFDEGDGPFNAGRYKEGALAWNN